MTETSWLWGGDSLGDAALAPYDDDEFTDIIRDFIFSWDRTTHGIINSNNPTYDDNLIPQINGAAVDVLPGLAVVDGKPYRSDDTESFTFTAPTVSTRYDRIVLRKDYGTQEVRLTKIIGIEGAGSPALVQSDPGDPGSVAPFYWDISLALVRLNVGSATPAVLTDQRYFCVSPLAPLYNRILYAYPGTGGAPTYTASAWNDIRGVTGDALDAWTTPLPGYWKVSYTVQLSLLQGVDNTGLRYIAFGSTGASPTGLTWGESIVDFMTAPTRTHVIMSGHDIVQLDASLDYCLKFYSASGLERVELAFAEMMYVGPLLL